VTEETVSSRGWQQERLLSDVASNSAFFSSKSSCKNSQSTIYTKNILPSPVLPF
jgi:hypothetical protein